jgi:geranylgeranyl reductase family protein
MSRLPTTCDVLVVGLGPAGASAARAAASSGARVVALDRRPVPGVPVQCGEFVPRSLAVETPAVRASIVQSVGAMHTFGASGDAPRVDALPGFIIDRARFDQTLVSYAREAGALCLTGHSLLDLTQAGAVLADGRTVSARVVIGADGPRSRVGRAVGIVNRILSVARQITVPLTREHMATDIFLSPDLPGGYGWLFPRGANANLGVGIDIGQRARLAGVLDNLHQRLMDERRVCHDIRATTGGLLPAGGKLPATANLAGLLVLLCGDAAGLTNPITGAGIASAVISGRIAGETAAAHLAGRASAGSDHETELADIFGVALARAVRHRQRILAAYDNGTLSLADLQRGWIAFDAYWRDETASSLTGVAA